MHKLPPQQRDGSINLFISIIKVVQYIVVQWLHMRHGVCSKIPMFNESSSFCCNLMLQHGNACSHCLLIFELGPGGIYVPGAPLMGAKLAWGLEGELANNAVVGSFAYGFSTLLLCCIPARLHHALLWTTTKHPELLSHFSGTTTTNYY